MPPSFYCKPRWIKAGGRLTGNSLVPPTQVSFMNNQSKKCLSEQHCPLNLYSWISCFTQSPIGLNTADLSLRVDFSPSGEMLAP
jgi:hypothetical protein